MIRSQKEMILAIAVITFTVAAALVTWIGFGQPRGLIHGMIYFETDFLQRLWPIVTLVILSLALATAFVSEGIPFGVVLATASPRSLRIIKVALLLGSVGASVLAVWALRAFPYSGDEYNYVFEAKTFLRGRLWNPLLPGHEFFSFYWIAEKAGKWVSDFPPGWPLFLAGAHLLRMPFWTVSPLFGTTALIFLAKLAGREEGPIGALTALALVVFSPFFAFNAGSFFSHMPTAAFGLIFCYFGAKFVDMPDWCSAAFIGAALGMVGLIRPYDTLFFAVPFGVEFVFRARRPHFACIPVIVLCGLPCLAALMLYTRAITGSAFLPVQIWAYSARLIGVNIVDLGGRVPVSMLQELLMAKTRTFMLAEWTSPILVLAYLPAVAWKIIKYRVRFYDFIFPATVIAYLFFPNMGGDQYGPRYYFEGFMLMPVTVGSMTVAWIREREGVPGRAAAGLTTAHVLTCLASLAVLLLFMRRVVNERFDIYDQVRQAGLHNALVIVHRHDIFTRNGLDRNGDVIYALDLPGRINELHRLFPDRQFYLYRRTSPEVLGELIPLQPASAPR